jgi:hypothetical protein
MNKTCTFAAFIFIAMGTLLASCTTVYRGFDGPQVDSNIAIVEVGSVWSNDANIVEVDGKFRGLGFIHRYELLPGERQLTVEFSNALYKAENIVTYFQAEAGKKYSIEAESVIGKGVAYGAAGRWRVVIRDASTREEVNYPSPKLARAR